MKLAISIILSAAFVLTGCRQAHTPVATPPAAQQPQFSAEGDAAAQSITGDYLGAQISTISGDEYEGRGPATPGDERTRKYLAGELQALGYEPGGVAGTWEQAFDIVGIDAKMPKQWSFRKDGKTLSLKWHDQYIAASGVQSPGGAIKDAEVVFVGYGIQAPEFQWDDFKGVDLKGKVLLMMNNDPDWDPALFAGNTRLYYGRWGYKYESAARAGAAGAIIIHTTASAGYPFQVVQSSWSGEQFQLPAGPEPRIQAQGWATEDAAKQLAALGGQDLAQLMESAKSRNFTPVPLGVMTSLQFNNTVKKKVTANVAGLLRGSDPKLAHQVVVFTAHHDHLGIGEPDKTGDRIYNGALDNGAGVAQILAVAKAFKALPTPPRRSVLILFVAAEEQGLLGSAWYAQHPTFPAGNIAANFNVDGGNVWGRSSDVTYIGKGKSSLDTVIEAFAKRQDRIVNPDAVPDRGFFYRSDQFSFAKIGVPAFYFHTPEHFRGKPAGFAAQVIKDWEENRYHQPSDEFDPNWNFDGMIEDAQLVFLAGLAVANDDALPTWAAGDEFEAARKSALGAVTK
ncbi:MAG: M20/M25/M40 family metallo-hydrolase [Steroidobacteraceae bacterium]